MAGLVAWWAMHGYESGFVLRIGIHHHKRGFMQVDAATVRRIARLARIKVGDAEVENLKGELSGILDWVKQLDEVDTQGVEPMTQVVAHVMTKRADKVTDGEIADQITQNAPLSEDNFFVVPKVVE
jgi:aspartyl-tRNA(Asn)/glutamyl-tRNA(Gln) amidotransferase subunit C